MSNVQIATEEPPTSAKVVLYTSHGEIDIQLWARETPLACRNFIQLCLESYYNNTIFHRMIPGFMIQGGDPTGTGMGGQSIFDGKPFNDEFHQRLKFVRRGIVAMANSGKNSNGSQFFITFGSCEHLNKKHTIFGKIVGDTIYNVMALQSLDTQKEDRPTDPPIIRKTKVITNPFADIVSRTIPETEQSKALENEVPLNKQQSEKRKLNKKAELKRLKKKNKLTFDIEQEFGEDAETSTGATKNVHREKIKSSHEVLAGKDSSLSNRQAISKEELERKRNKKKLQEERAEEARLKILQAQQSNPNDSSAPYDKKISKQMLKKLQEHQKVITSSKVKQEEVEYERRFNPETKKYEIVFADELKLERERAKKEAEAKRKAEQEAKITDEKLRAIRQQQRNEYELLKADELNFKKAKEGSLKQKRKGFIEEQKKLLSNLQKHRFEFKQKQKTEKHEGHLFEKLMGFTNRLKGREPTTSTSDWMNHQLKFHIDSGNAYSLQEKKNAVGAGNQMFSDLDDGGLKIEDDYYLKDEEARGGNDLDSLLKEVTQNEIRMPLAKKAEVESGKISEQDEADIQRQE